MKNAYFDEKNTQNNTKSRKNEENEWPEMI